MRALSTRAYPVNLVGAAAMAAGVMVALALLILIFPGTRQQDAAHVSGIVPQATTKTMSFLEANTFLPPVSQAVPEALPVETMRFFESNTFLPPIGESANVAGESGQETAQPGWIR
jgi:hypothetical protein